MVVLVDTNIILDLLTEDPFWSSWSAEVLLRHQSDELVINPAIFAELAYGFDSVEQVEFVIRDLQLLYQEIPRGGLFKAAQAFRSYKNSGGNKHFVLPDFFIGGHAAASQLPIITRDTGRYRSYFPNVELISPDPSPPGG
jgi:hypothetical protein